MQFCKRAVDDETLSTILSQRIYEASFLQRPAIVKERFKKEYRHPSLDEKLTKDRLSLVRSDGFGFHILIILQLWSGISMQDCCLQLLIPPQEGRCMVRARAAGVDAPLLLFVDTVCCRIFMERIHGQTVKSYLTSGQRSSSGEDRPGPTYTDPFISASRLVEVWPLLLGPAVLPFRFSRVVPNKLLVQSSALWPLPLARELLDYTVPILCTGTSQRVT